MVAALFLVRLPSRRTANVDPVHALTSEETFTMPPNIRRTLASVVRMTPTVISGQLVRPSLTPVEFWQLRQTADSFASANNLSAAANSYRQLVAVDTVDIQLWFALANAEFVLQRPA